MTDRENKGIYFPELLCGLLECWKILLCIALAAALICGAFVGIWNGKLLSDPACLQEAVLYNEVAQEQYENRKDALQQQIVLLRESIHKQQTYLRESVLMNLDPYDFYAGSIRIYVQTDYQILPDMSYQNPDRTDTVRNTYISHLYDVELMGQLASAANLTPQYVTELLSVSMADDSSMVTIQIRHYDAEMVSRILTLVSNYLEQLPLQLPYEHTAQISVHSADRQMDTALQNQQAAKRDQLDTMLTALSSAQSRLENLQEPELKSVTMEQVLLQVLCVGLIGGGLALLLAALLRCWWISSTARILSRRALEQITPVLAGVCLTEPKGKGTRWCSKIMGCSTDPERMQHLVTDLGNRCSDSLLVTGDVPDALSKLLADRLPNATVRQDLLSRVQAVEALTACQNVVLVVHRGVTTRQQVEQQLQMIGDYGKQLIGCVLIETKYGKK